MVDKKRNKKNEINNFIYSIDIFSICFLASSNVAVVSGVSSINFAILVIAADDGAMPQTYEHLEILELLNIKSGLIVINKIDLVDSELLEMVELEINEFKKNTFLENCTIIKTSTKTGLGIDKLKNEILNLKKNKFDHFDRGIFGMFIDRVFTKKEN